MGRVGHGDTNRARAQRTSSTPASVMLARALFSLLAAIWILFAVVILTRMAAGGAGHANTALTVAMLMLVNAGVMLWIGRGITRASRRFYYLGIVVLGANVVMTVTDEFGVFDFLVLVVSVVLLALLIVTRSRYCSVR